MNTIYVAICDDDSRWVEEASAQILRFSEEHGRDLQMRCFAHPEELLAFLREEDSEKPDLIFMDIAFGDVPAGIDMTGEINRAFPACQVAYLTNYLSYAVDVYQTDHIWYVLKPQLQQRLPEIVAKLEAQQAHRRQQLILDLTDGSMVKLHCAQILFMERRGRITYVQEAEGSYETRMRIPQLVSRLDTDSFARCHNSIIVHLPHVRELHARSVIMEDGTELPVSRSYKHAFHSAWMRWAQQTTLV